MGSDALEESLTDCTEAGNVDETVLSGAGVEKSCESPSMNANSLLSVRRARSRPFSAVSSCIWRSAAFS